MSRQTGHPTASGRRETTTATGQCHTPPRLLTLIWGGGQAHLCNDVFCVSVDERLVLLFCQLFTIDLIKVTKCHCLHLI